MEDEFYSRYAEWDANHWWFRGRRAIVDAVLQRELPDRPLRILDFGCGPGAMIELLARHGEVSGVDGSEEAVRLSQARGFDVTLLPPGDPVPYDDATFDVVTAFDVIEHIDDDVAAIRELRRVLKPGGTLIATVPAFMALWGDQDVVSHHVRRYRARSFRQAVQGADLRMGRLSYFNTFLFPPIAAMRMLRRVRRAPDAAKTDFDATPTWLDGTLTAIMAAEAPLVARWRLPVGVSLIATATRP